jgi:uncharacterized protein (UPF0371 family)
MKKGFDSQAYIDAQTAEIMKRVKKFKRLYLEFGGKLIYDRHAARVLPGYKKTTKVDLLKSLNDVRIIYCVNAKDLESNKLVGRSKRTYQQQVLKDLKDINSYKLPNDIIVITRFSGEPKAQEFAKTLLKLNKQVYFHEEIRGYTESAERAISGYDKQCYIPIKENLIAITGPAGGSGKMAVALTQIYHERKNNLPSAFAKFETFPIWNLPLNHPINLAYEAATADLQDKNMIDPFHKKAYRKIAVNYNRDINNFKILQELIRKITKQKFPFGYKSPTDMGVNMAKTGIVNEEICKKAAIKEINRRYKFYKHEFKKGRESELTVKRMEEILNQITSS